MVPTHDAHTPDPFSGSPVASDTTPAPIDHEFPIDWAAGHRFYLSARAIFLGHGCFVAEQIERLSREELVALNLAGEQAALLMAGVPAQLFDEHDLEIEISKALGPGRVRTEDHGGPTLGGGS